MAAETIRLSRFAVSSDASDKQRAWAHAQAFLLQRRLEATGDFEVDESATKSQKGLRIEGEKTSSSINLRLFRDGTRLCELEGQTLDELVLSLYARLGRSPTDKERTGLSAYGAKDSYALFLLGRALEFQFEGQVRAAQRDLERAIRVEPTFAEAHLALARVLVRLGQKHEATVEYHRASDLREVLPAAQRELAALYSELGMHAGAATELEAPASVAPLDRDRLESLVEHYRALKQDQNAFEKTTELATRFSDDVQAHRLLAQTARDVDKADAAVSALQMVLTLDPTDAIAHVEIAAYEREQGRLVSALVHARTAVQLEPKNGIYRWILADVLAESGEPKQAIAILQGALELGVKTPWLRAKLGMLLLKAGRFAQAKIQLQRATYALPDDPNLQLNFGLALSAVGKLDQAEWELAQVLRKDPDRAEARLALCTVLQKLYRRCR